MVRDALAPYHVEHLDTVSSHAAGYACVDDELGCEVADEGVGGKGGVDFADAACRGYDFVLSDRAEIIGVVFKGDQSDVVAHTSEQEVQFLLHRYDYCYFHIVYVCEGSCFYLLSVYRVSVEGDGLSDVAALFVPPLDGRF